MTGLAVCRAATSANGKGRGTRAAADIRIIFLANSQWGYCRTRISIHSRNGRACLHLLFVLALFPFPLDLAAVGGAEFEFAIRIAPAVIAKPAGPLSSFQGSAEAASAANTSATAHMAVHKDIFIAFSLWCGYDGNVCCAPPFHPEDGIGGRVPPLFAYPETIGYPARLVLGLARGSLGCSEVRLFCLPCSGWR
jgi:hypothetical protein